MPEQVNPVLHPPREQPVKNVGADMLGLLQRLGRRQQKGRAKQIPLQFQR